MLGSIFSEEILENRNILELTRLFIHDGYGKNIESLALGLTFKWLRENEIKHKGFDILCDPNNLMMVLSIRLLIGYIKNCGDFQLAPTYSLRLEENGEWML